MGYKVRVTTSKDKIINIKNKYDEMVSYFLGIDIGVKMTSRKINIEKKTIHFCLQIPRIFPRDIEIFLKETNKVGVILNISRRLFHVNFLMKITM